MAKVFERRMSVTGLEFRDDDSSGVQLSGYASTFNQAYDMGWYSEIVAPDAFSRTLGTKPDVRLLINHDGLPLARTTSGTLTLGTDRQGLTVRADLDPTDPDVASLIPKMRRGDVNAMSFGFRVIADEWEPDMSKRTLRTLDLNDGDVSVVTYPANPNTSVAMRSDGRAMDAIASALRCLESRGASEADVTALLARALRTLSADDAVTDPGAAIGAELAAAAMTPDDARELIAQTDLEQEQLSRARARRRLLALL